MEVCEFVDYEAISQKKADTIEHIVVNLMDLYQYGLDNGLDRKLLIIVFQEYLESIK